MFTYIADRDGERREKRESDFGSARYTFSQKAVVKACTIAQAVSLSVKSQQGQEYQVDVLHRACRSCYGFRYAPFVLLQDGSLIKMNMLHVFFLPVGAGDNNANSGMFLLQPADDGPGVQFVMPGNGQKNMEMANLLQVNLPEKKAADTLAKVFNIFSV